MSLTAKVMPELVNSAATHSTPSLGRSDIRDRRGISSVTANSTDGRSLTLHAFTRHSRKSVNPHSLIGTKNIFSVSPTPATSRVVTHATRVWFPGNAQPKTERPILTVRNPRQTMRALRRASLCNCSRSGYPPRSDRNSPDSALASP